MSDLTFPPHLTLSLRHNEHKACYQTVAEYCEEFDRDDWVSEHQRLKAMGTDEIWELQWYPDTPVGFCLRLAADLESLLEWMQPDSPSNPPRSDENAANQESEAWTDPKQRAEAALRKDWETGGYKCTFEQFRGWAEDSPALRVGPWLSQRSGFPDYDFFLLGVKRAMAQPKTENNAQPRGANTGEEQQDEANTLKGLSGDEAEAAGRAEYYRVTQQKDPLQWSHTAPAPESISPNPKDPKGTK